MLNPSYTYLNSYKAAARQVTGRVSYTLDGTDYVIRPDGTLSKIIIEKSSPQGKLFGFAVSQKLTVEVLGILELPKGTRLIPEIFIKDSEDIVELPYFLLAGPDEFPRAANSTHAASNFCEDRPF